MTNREKKGLLLFIFGMTILLTATMFQLDNNPNYWIIYLVAYGVSFLGGGLFLG